jgi:hypothetical protein
MKRTALSSAADDRQSPMKKKPTRTGAADDDEAAAAEATQGYRLPPPQYARSAYVAVAPDDVLHMLLRYGVAVVPNVLSRERAAEVHAGLMGALEGAFPGFGRDAPETWRLLRDNGAKHAMLLQNHGLGWCQAAVDVRQDPAVAEQFAALWSARARCANAAGAAMPIIVTKEQMLASGDGVSVYLNVEGERGGFHREGREWLHWDRAPNDKRWSVQGFVNLLPTSEHGAAFQCLVKSHRYQAEFAERFQRTDQRFNLLRSQAEADFYVRDKGCHHICVGASVGDLVLWDSRAIHCGRAASRNAALLQRAVIYVSMQPKRLSTPRDIELKRRAHKQLRSTTHNAASGVELFSVYPRVRCARDEALRQASHPVSVPPRLTPLGRSLFGLLPRN